MDRNSMHGMNEGLVWCSLQIVTGKQGVMQECRQSLGSSTIDEATGWVLWAARGTRDGRWHATWNIGCNEGDALSAL